MQATLVIAASDYVQYALLTRFSVALRTEAPKVRIAWRALDVMGLSTQLEHGEVDLALAFPDHAPAAMRQRQLYSSRRSGRRWRHTLQTRRGSGTAAEFKRRIKTQTVLPSFDIAAMLFWALMASGQVLMRKVDGWTSLATPVADQPVVLAA